MPVRRLRQTRKNMQLKSACYVLCPVMSVDLKSQCAAVLECAALEVYGLHGTLQVANCVAGGYSHPINTLTRSAAHRTVTTDLN